MLLNYHEAEELDNKVGSSFFLFEISKLHENFKKINDAFKSRYEHLIIGYSYKTNYLPFLCKEMSHLGAYAEVVSRLEYDLAIKIGVDPRKIIFNGPLKNYEDIKTALDNESILNIDSHYEIEHIQNYCFINKDKRVKIGIRVNFDLSEDGKSPLQEGYEVSRFGICVENGGFQSAIMQLRSIENLKIVGLHGHFSTTGRKAKTYRKITEELCELAERYIEELEYIDIGGGFYGELPSTFKMNAPSFDNYAEEICEVMNSKFNNRSFKPFLIIEPGISMVANTFQFITKVIETKNVRDHHFVLVDGSVHNIKPTMHKKNLPMKMIHKESKSRNQGSYNIVGYTCMEKDYLAHEVKDAIPEKGDFIVFENVGAYTIVFNPPFIKERPAIVAKDNNEYFIVRKKERLKDFFNEDLYVF